MTTTVEIKTEEIYPADYKIHNIGDNVAIRLPTKTEYYTVYNRNKVQPFVKQDTTNWLLSAGSSYNAGDISNWLEPETNVLYSLAAELDSDRNIEFRIYNPSSDQLGGIKSTPDAIMTPDTTPLGKPNMTLQAWGTTYVPSFKLTNPTEYTPVYVIIRCYGFKYRLEKINLLEEGRKRLGDRAGRMSQEAVEHAGIPAKYDTVDFTYIK